VLEDEIVITRLWRDQPEVTQGCLYVGIRTRFAEGSPSCPLFRFGVGTPHRCVDDYRTSQPIAVGGCNLNGDHASKAVTHQHWWPGEIGGIGNGHHFTCPSLVGVGLATAAITVARQIQCDNMPVLCK